MIVSLTPLPDMAPVPRVEVRLEAAVVYDGGSPGETGPSLSGGTPGGTGQVLDGGTPATVSVDVPAGTDRVTLWRTCQGRSIKVRGGVDRFYGGSFALLDLEAGFDRASTYELECWDGSTPVGRVALGSVTLPGPDDPWVTVVQQPLEPRLNVVFEETGVNAPGVGRVGPGSLVTVEGKSYPTVLSQGPRGGLSGVELSFAATTREVAAAAWATVGSEDDPQLPVWLVRSRHPLLPAVFFCDNRGLQEIGVNLHVGGTESRFELTVEEVAPPAPALVVSPLSYTDLDVSFPGYDVMDAAFTSYDARDSAWEYAGASGG